METNKRNEGRSATLRFVYSEAYQIFFVGQLHRMTTWAWKPRHLPPILEVCEAEVERDESSFIGVVLRLGDLLSDTSNRRL